MYIKTKPLIYSTSHLYWEQSRLQYYWSTLVTVVIVNITAFNQDITNYDQQKNFVLMSICSLLYLTPYNKDKYGKNPKQDKRFGKVKDLKIMGLNLKINNNYGKNTKNAHNFMADEYLRSKIVFRNVPLYSFFSFLKN